MNELIPSRLLIAGVSLILIGTIGFHTIPGMINDEDGGGHWVNAFYCSVITLTTVGYGDICPSTNTPPLGRLFIVIFSFLGLGLFCGPIMDFASSWNYRIPGGMLGVMIFVIGLGVVVFTYLEEMTVMEAMYFTTITGTTIGYGDVGPKTDAGKVATALFAILSVNVMGGLLEPGKNVLTRMLSIRGRVDAGEDDDDEKKKKS